MDARNQDHLSRFHHSYQDWLIWTSATGLLLLLIAFFRPPLALVAFLIWAVAAGNSLFSLGGRPSRPADYLTLVRLLLLLSGVGLLLLREDFLPSLCLFALAALGDLADGWMARRYGETPQGAVYDMETDQLLITALALSAHATVSFPPWILLFPAFKFVNVLGLHAIGVKATNPKPIDGDNRRGRIVCALVVIALLTTLLPGALEGWRLLAVFIVLLALAASFAADFRFLWSRYRENRMRK